jgi:acetoacetyl-CoA synthetase
LPVVTPEILWSPPPDVRGRSRMGRYLTWLEAARDRTFEGYADLWQWSVDEPAAFWRSIWDHFEVGEVAAPPAGALADARMPGAVWFPGTLLNYAEQVLRLPERATDDVVLIGRSQTRQPTEMTAGELREQVARCRTGLLRLGVRRGDRVAAFLPNIPEAVVGLLATANIGAIWTSCAPEFGARAVIDRLGQVGPKVLVTVDGYRYGDKAIDRAPALA